MYCCPVPSIQTFRAFLRSHSVALALYFLVCGHVPVRGLSNPTQLHSFTFNWRWPPKSDPKTDWHIGGRGEGVLPGCSSSVVLMISLGLLHLFAWFLGASCVRGWQMGKEKSACFGTLSKLKACLGLAFSLPVLEWKSIPADNYAFLFCFKAALEGSRQISFQPSPFDEAQKG